MCLSEIIRYQWCHATYPTCNSKSRREAVGGWLLSLVNKLWHTQLSLRSTIIVFLTTFLARLVKFLLHLFVFFLTSFFNSITCVKHFKNIVNAIVIFSDFSKLSFFLMINTNPGNDYYNFLKIDFICLLPELRVSMFVSRIFVIWMWFVETIECNRKPLD